MDYDKILGAMCTIISFVATVILAFVTGLLKWAEGGIFQIIICAAVMAFSYLFFGFITTIFGDDLISKKFREESNMIVREYEKTKDAEKFYTNLVQMKNKPKTQTTKNMLAFNFSTALFNLGKTDEALKKLDEIKNAGREMEGAVKKQKEDILSKSK